MSLENYGLIAIIFCMLAILAYVEKAERSSQNLTQRNIIDQLKSRLDHLNRNVLQVF